MKAAKNKRKHFFSLAIKVKKGDFFFNDGAESIFLIPMLSLKHH